MRIVKTKTSDGLHLNGLLSSPNQKTERIVIHFHGMAGSPLLNEYYQDMHSGYTDAGISFLVVEHRGTGTITEFVSDSGVRLVGNAFEKFEESVFDIQAWIDFAEKSGFNEIWLQSHSLGPSKVAYYTSVKQSKTISGLIFISPSDMSGLVHDKEGIKDHRIMLPEAKKLVAEGKGHRLIDHKLWGGEYLSASTYLNLFDEGAKTAIFNYLDDSLGWKVVNSINLPVLAITGENDDGIATVMNPERAMEKLKMELIKSPKVKTVVFEKADHSFDGFGKKIVREVVNFIKVERNSS